MKSDRRTLRRLGHNRSVVGALAAVGIGAIAALGAFAGTAGAQTDPYDPYDPYLTPTSTPDSTPDDPYDPYEPIQDSAPVCTSGPTIALDSSTEVAGGDVVVTVTCFEGGTTAKVTMYSTPTALGEMLIGSDGIGKKTFTIPCEMAAGDHTIEATGTDANGNDAKVSAALSVTAAVCGSNQPGPGSNNGGGGGGGNLARTGATVGLIALVGAALVIGGYLIIKRADQLTGE